MPMLRDHRSQCVLPLPLLPPPHPPSTSPLHIPPSYWACVLQALIFDQVFHSAPSLVASHAGAKGVWGCNFRSEITHLRLTPCRWACSTSPMSCTCPLKPKPHLGFKASAPSCRYDESAPPYDESFSGESSQLCICTPCLRTVQLPTHSRMFPCLQAWETTKSVSLLNCTRRYGLLSRMPLGDDDGDGGTRPVA